MPHYEHINFALPKNWQLSTLGEVFYMHAGKNIVASEISSNADETYRYKCIGGNGLRGYVQQFNTEGSFPIIGRQGALCGNINYVEGRFYATEHAVVVDTFCKTNVKWAFYFLIKLNLNQYATATAQPGLSVNRICDVQIPLPPLTEQQRIVAEIERWFALIDTVEQGKADLQTAIKQTKSKILDLAIHGKLVPQDPNDEPASELLKRINPKAQITCDNEHYPKLPKGWSIYRLGDVVKYEQPTAYIVQSTAYSDAYPIPVLTAGKLFIIGHTKETEGIYNRLPCIIFDDFTTDSRLVDFPFKVKSSAMKILQVHYGVEVEYVSLFMSITRLVGDTHKRYWISEYSKLEIPIPPQEEQKRIIGNVRLLFEVLDVIEESL